MISGLNDTRLVSKLAEVRQRGHLEPAHEPDLASSSVDRKTRERADLNGPEEEVMY